MNRENVYRILDEVMRQLGNIIIIHGDAHGADRLAGEWAKGNGVEVLVFPAKWDVYGGMAGMVRNREMLISGRPDFVIAFPGGKGTKNMIGVAKRANVPVFQVEDYAQYKEIA